MQMLGRNSEKVAKVAEQLATHKDRVHTVVDVTKQEQVQQAIEGTAAEAGRLDMLFNNAGIPGPKLFEMTTPEDFKTITDTNLWSVVYSMRTVVPIMLKQGSGHIVNTSSYSGLVPYPGSSLYSMTKFAVTGLTEALKYEYADRNIHFSTICPGNIATPILKKDMYSKVNEELPSPPDAIPANKATVYILDRVAERKGIIVVPEEPWADLWKGYVLGGKAVEEMYLRHARYLLQRILETTFDVPRNLRHYSIDQFK
jgi:NAD(P)-dependent dehydrogenase (short-subunit alcohol dehydrogenase family)